VTRQSARVAGSATWRAHIARSCGTLSGEPVCCAKMRYAARCRRAQTAMASRDVASAFDALPRQQHEPAAQHSKIYGAACYVSLLPRGARARYGANRCCAPLRRAYAVRASFSFI